MGVHKLRFEQISGIWFVVCLNTCIPRWRCILNQVIILWDRAARSKIDRSGQEIHLQTVKFREIMSKWREIYKESIFAVPLAEDSRQRRQELMMISPILGWHAIIDPSYYLIEASLSLTFVRRLLVWIVWRLDCIYFPLYDKLSMRRVFQFVL